MFKILTLNNISVKGLERLPRERYEVASEIQHPDAILVRSFNMHEMSLPSTLKAVGRAGTGVNNIPVGKMSQRGIPVFNAPGANANAVKELVLAGMLLAARNICSAWEYVRRHSADSATLEQELEAGKKQFVGFELPGRTLGVIGLGAIGVKVANAAIALGMRVVGYDPDITVRRAWQLSSEVRQASSVDDVMRHADFVSLHVPFTESNRHLINTERLRQMSARVTVVNFSRAEVVDEQAMLAALEEGHVRSYVTDFPSPLLQGRERVLALPHIGASTLEAEENCAIMVADQVREFLEDGTIRNAVNFPEAAMARNRGYRLAVVNANVPNMLAQISSTLAAAGLNIADMLNQSRGAIAYTLTDVEDVIPADVVAQISAIEGVLTVRTL